MKTEKPKAKAKPKQAQATQQGRVNLNIDEQEMAKLNLEQARDALSKLPMMGPAFWLYGRDPRRKYTFIADMDWLVLPPVVLDQCKLYSNNGIPFGFFTWANVSDEIDARLCSGISKLAVHEWHSGPHVWLIDMVAPFGKLDEMLNELKSTNFAGQKIQALMPDPARGGQVIVREWPAVPAAEANKE